MHTMINPCLCPKCGSKYTYIFKNFVCDDTGIVGETRICMGCGVKYKNYYDVVKQEIL